MSPEEPDDQALARAAARGDRQALEDLLERHADHVHTLCRRVLGDPHDALDAAQEAFIAIARGIRGFDGRSRFTTWMHRVTINAAIDEARRRGRRPVPHDEVPEPRESRPGPEDAVIAKLDVDAALRGLAPEFRAAVALRDFADLDYAEIADVLDVPIGTVRSRIARGRRAIADQLGNPATGSERPMGTPPTHEMPPR